jgi:FkbM family methyltransferase
MNEVDAYMIYFEIIDQQVYSYWRDFAKGDIVVDVGASVGSVSKLALSQGASKVFCVEPSVSFCKSIEENLSKYDNYIVVNKAISNNPSNVGIYVDEPFETIRFKDFIKENNISKIDYLKLDCEGGEYDIFIEENMDYLLNNVEFIAAEFHLRGTLRNYREDFKTFMNDILPRFSNYQIKSCIHQKIKPGQSIDLSGYVKNEEFIDTYNCELMIYIWNNTNK